ncbi:MAG: response regulator [Syntrophales bacterium]
MAGGILEGMMCSSTDMVEVDDDASSVTAEASRRARAALCLIFRKDGGEVPVEKSDLPVEKTLLVVDDEESLRSFFHEILTEEGYRVLTAEGAVDALEILSREQVGVLLLDLNLFGMNGIELCRKIRREKPLCVLYAMTGWTGLFEVEECREAGFDDFFTKPLPVDFLYRVVEDAFEKLARWRRGYTKGP